MSAKISISNIAWNINLNGPVYELLCKSSISGVEVAPTKFADWENLTPSVLQSEALNIKSFGLKISSYQAILYGKPDLQLLCENYAFEQFLDHAIRVAQIAENLSDGGIGVFGAPRNRLLGALNSREAFDLGAHRLTRVAQAIAPYGFILALESAPNLYGGEFLTTISECAEMVKQVNHPSLRLHVDTGCANLSNESCYDAILNNKHILSHIHLSNSYLSPINSDISAIYGSIYSAIEKSNYDGWIALEMRETTDTLVSIQVAIDAVLGNN